MTATPDAAGSDAPGWEIPADDVADEEVDVLPAAVWSPVGRADHLDVKVFGDPPHIQPGGGTQPESLV